MGFGISFVPDFDYSCLPKQLYTAAAHLVLVENPDFHPEGDFNLVDELITPKQKQAAFTFAGIGVYHPRLFSTCDDSKQKIKPLLDDAIKLRQVNGEIHKGQWLDIGTPERLEMANNLAT